MTEKTRGPGVPFPPPFVFVAGFTAAWFLDRRLPFEVDGAGAGPAQVAGGTVFLIGGLGLMAWGLATFLRARTSVIPNRPARLLVTGGPYRFSRNPMYVGLTFAYLGLSALMNAAWPLVLLPVVLIVLAMTVILPEERYLRAEFGDAYDDYTRRVRRFL